MTFIQNTAEMLLTVQRLVRQYNFLREINNFRTFQLLPPEAMYRAPRLWHHECPWCHRCCREVRLCGCDGLLPGHHLPKGAPVLPTGWWRPEEGSNREGGGGPPPAVKLDWHSTCHASLPPVTHCHWPSMDTSIDFPIYLFFNLSIKTIKTWDLSR